MDGSKIMELKQTLHFFVDNMFCEFRCLKPKDVSSKYIEGLKNYSKFILRVPEDVNMEIQKKYINNILESENATIFGLFLQEKLIGTSGIQKTVGFVNLPQIPVVSIATLGIFIFDLDYRSFGLGKTLVWAATHLYHSATVTIWYGAGIEKENIPSQKSFLSCGYKPVYEDTKNLKVVLNYTELKKPNIINNVSLKYN